MGQFSSGQSATELELARASAVEAEKIAGLARARLRAVEDQLEAALAEQQEWPLLLAQLEGELAMGEHYRSQLEAVKASRSWKLIWSVMTPYRAFRTRFASGGSSQA